VVIGLRGVGCVVTADTGLAAAAAGMGIPWVLISSSAVGRELADGFKARELHIEV
jgi:hypothetical protein